MAKDKNMMPQSTAGLIRYFDSGKTAFRIKPEHVAIAASAIIVLEIMLKFV